MERVQHFLNAVVAVAARCNLKMKAGPAKTALMIFGGGEDLAEDDPRVAMSLGVGGPSVPLVPRYRYLGRIVDHATSLSDTVISARISAAWSAVHLMTPLWDCAAVQQASKERLLDCLVRSSLVFSAASWIPTQAQLQRLDRAFTRMRCRALGIPRYSSFDPPRCTSLRVIYANAELASSTAVRNRLRLLGHICRRYVALHDVLQWEPIGECRKRKCGGRRRSLLDSLLLDFAEADRVELKGSTSLGLRQTIPTGRNVDFALIEQWASDRSRWRRVIERAVQQRQQYCLLPV
jgi:hypothetical protein